MAVRTFLLLLASSCVTFAFVLKECPPKESTTCECKDPARGIYECKNLASQKALEDNVRALKGYYVETLRLDYVNASTLPTDLFEGLHVKSLKIFYFEASQSTFGEERSHFLGLEHTLEQLVIYRSFRKTPITSLKLDHLNSLKKIDLFENNIPAIGNEWFLDGPKRVDHIIADWNGIEKLGDEAFAPLRNLHYLDLQHNSLKEMSRSMLPYPAFQLRKLNLAHNFLSTLPDDFFTEMPALFDVNLENNLIQTISEDIFTPILLNLHILRLHDNPLRCDQDLKWLCNHDNYIFLAKCASPADKGRSMFISDFCKEA